MLWYAPTPVGTANLLSSHYHPAGGVIVIIRRYTAGGMVYNGPRW